MTEAAHWQRYSWTGSPLDEGITPTFGDGSNWQANTEGDPHKIGVGGRTPPTAG